MHDEESYEVHVSLNIQVMNSSRIRWVEHVARMGERKGHTRFCWKNLREGDRLETLGMDRRISLKRIFKNWFGGMGWIELAQCR